MKKLLIISLMILTTGLSSVFAGNNDDDIVSSRVLTAFTKDFPGATDISWRGGSKYLTATFWFNGQGLSAYYTEDGRFLGTTRNVLYSQLPIAVNKAIADRYDISTVSGIFEFSNGESSEYYMHVEKKNKRYFVKVSPSGCISVVKRIKD